MTRRTPYRFTREPGLTRWAVRSWRTGLLVTALWIAAYGLIHAGMWIGDRLHIGPRYAAERGRR